MRYHVKGKISYTEVRYTDYHREVDVFIEADSQEEASDLVTDEHMPDMWGELDGTDRKLVIEEAENTPEVDKMFNERLMRKLGPKVAPTLFTA